MEFNLFRWGKLFRPRLAPSVVWVQDEPVNGSSFDVFLRPEHIIMGKALTEDDFVFSHMDGTPLNPNTVSHTFSKIVARAGLSHLRLHDLRHIHATMLLKAGTHPRIVQERLGHSSIATTLDIYSHTVPGLQKAAAERLDTLLPVQEQKENVGKMSAKGGENSILTP